MEKKLSFILVLLFSLFLVGFDVGEEVELDTFLNGRSTANFLTTTKNVITTLSKGTKGTVEEVKKFSSGNSGIKMKVTSGQHSGKSYWVYYNKKNPALKKVLPEEETNEAREAQAQAEPAIEKEALELKEKEKIVTTMEVAARKVASEAEDDPEQALIQLLPLLSGPELLSNLSPASPDCLFTAVEQPAARTPAETPSAILSTQKADVPEADYRETDTLRPPYRERPRPRDTVEPVIPNRNPYKYTSAKDMPDQTCPYVTQPAIPQPVRVYSYCLRAGSVEGFTLENTGPNKINPFVNPPTEFFIQRKFEFEFPDRARSDMRLMISDSPNEKPSRTTYSMMMFFPRTTLPSIEHIGNELRVTLPNKEVVVYDATTKEIIGGVFAEKRMTRNSQPAAINYTGSGVVIRADKRGDLPLGDIETSSGKRAPSVTTATVSKKGHRDCKIPSKDLWYNDSARKDILMKPELASDDGLDKFLLKRCGFSLY